ncbi:uncharacterized protein LOC110436196 isoform X2 [Sorghum bicolor]|uniref:uncharacterized protein LOC110429561 isoform X2 n=1 Tax=Sorghum bicolor TaxID=4558 RepID=UPI000B4255E9|nr:uncharacterized protein LOC110429561 isoform X2 [Sorghum bicolor]XP_021318265.1 uncharacterized protein LOC110436196 isoform X2 [Sorghum bicolor]|eukprot:XP_021301314.1 uncharacterized protein LOC110429561 isoform X2 [Sorghum bicolor]
MKNLDLNQGYFASFLFVGNVFYLNKPILVEGHQEKLNITGTNPIQTNAALLGKNSYMFEGGCRENNMCARHWNCPSASAKVASITVMSSLQLVITVATIG